MLLKVWQGNKGGVGLRFKFRDTTFCFVVSHLAAFDNMLDKRNADYLEITRRLQFPIDAPVLSSMEEEQLVSVSASIFESDVLIWLVGPHCGLLVRY
jgi:inositol polyphosphate 5-phosphatase INPP5B/F